MNVKFLDPTVENAPYILVVGDKEAEAGAVSLRVRGRGDKGQAAIGNLLARAQHLMEENATGL